jgi:hypothetical protein
MKLTFAVAFILAILVAGTTTICMSGVVTARTSEYGSARAITGDLFNLPHSKNRLCR